MSPPRLLLVLAIVTALLGAPSATFAVSNDLSAAQASPATGSTSTTFTFRVTYDGRFPATSVTATVAGRTLAMRLIGGSAENGTWSVSTTLPMGSWQVVFSATVERGAGPSLAGPTVSVAATATMLPEPRTTVEPPSPRTDTPAEADPEPEPGPTSGPAEPAPASPASTPVPADEPEAAPVRSPSVSSAGGEGPASSAPTLGAGPSSGSSAGTVNGAPASAAAPRPSGGAAAPVAPANVGKGEEPSHEGDDGTLSTILVVALSGVAAVALLGTAVLMAARRRSERDEPAGVTGPAIDSTVDAIVERRTLRRARVRMTDDPIIASMGLGAERRAGRRTRQIGGGPGEREPRRPD